MALKDIGVHQSQRIPQRYPFVTLLNIRMSIRIVIDFPKTSSSPLNEGESGGIACFKHNSLQTIKNLSE